MWQFMAEYSNCSRETPCNVGSKRSSNGHPIGEIMEPISHHHHPRNRAQCVRRWMYVAVCVWVTMVLILVLPVRATVSQCMYTRNLPQSVLTSMKTFLIMHPPHGKKILSISTLFEQKRNTFFSNFAQVYNTIMNMNFFFNKQWGHD